MTLIELLDRLIAGQPVTPADAQAVKSALPSGPFGGVKQDGDRLRNAAKRLTP